MNNFQNNNDANKLKLYKFRELGTDDDFERLKSIIETGCFWCSNFWDLNDPMEGVYRNPKIIGDEIGKIFENKAGYKICSFSGKNGLKNPLVWGYYANGFKGVAIEIEVKKNDSEIKEIKYLSKKEFKSATNDVIEILTKKLDNWKHENEFRFLKETQYNNEHEIGNITKVFFGNPYGKLINSDDVIRKSEKLKKYNELKIKLREICKGKGIIDSLSCR